MVAYSFKKRFVAPIQVGLGIYRGEPETALRAAWPAAKRQTIRAIGRRRHARPGETLQLYTAMRTKQCAKIGDAQCIAVRSIKILFAQSAKQTDMISIERERPIMEIEELDLFAANDGFESWNEMRKFWDDEHGLVDFRGVLIQWEQI